MGHEGNRGVEEDAKVLGLGNIKNFHLQRGRRQEEEQSWEGQ